MFDSMDATSLTTTERPAGRAAETSQFELLTHLKRASDQVVLDSMTAAGYPTMTMSVLRVLELVAGADGSPASVIKELHVTQQYVSKCLRVLTELDCVEQHGAGNDRRRRTFVPTDRGLRALALARATKARVDAAVAIDLQPAADRLDEMIAEHRAA